MAKFTYIEVKDDQGKVLSIARSDGASIPTDPNNADYQTYLESLEA